MPKPKAKHLRWKQIVQFKVCIDVAATGQMWRVRTSKETSAPIGKECLHQRVVTALGTSDTYIGTVCLRRIK